jgi:hypothetical protein
MRRSGDRVGDSEGDVHGACAGGRCPHPSSLISPLSPTGSRFWALSQSEAESDADELASVEELGAPSASGGGPGRASVTLGPFIDRALSSPGWTRAGRGRHGVRRATGVRHAGSAAAPPSVSAPDPVGSFDLTDFPPLPGLVPSGAEEAALSRAPVLQVGEMVFPAVATADLANPGFLRAPAAAVPSGRRSPLASGSQVSGAHVAGAASRGV